MPIVPQVPKERCKPSHARVAEARVRLGDRSEAALHDAVQLVGGRLYQLAAGVGLRQPTSWERELLALLPEVTQVSVEFGVNALLNGHTPFWLHTVTVQFSLSTENSASRTYTFKYYFVAPEYK